MTTKLEELKASFNAAYADAEDVYNEYADADAIYNAYAVAEDAWDAYQEELKKQKEITMYAPELNMDISGWYEAEEGVDFVEIYEALDVKDLANKLLDKYGDDIIGVDMELDGEYTDGSAVNDMAVMVELERIGG
jgi:hypothetical protein